MKTSTITRERLNSSDNFRVQVHPPDRLLFGVIYNFMCNRMPEQAADARDLQGKAIQDTFVMIMKFLLLLPSLREDFAMWISDPENVEEELFSELMEKLKQHNIAPHGTAT